METQPIPRSRAAKPWRISVQRDRVFCRITEALLALLVSGIVAACESSGREGANAAPGRDSVTVKRSATMWPARDGTRIREVKSPTVPE